MSANPTRLEAPMGAPVSPLPQKTHSGRTTFVRAALPLAVGIAIALAPTPRGLAPNAWHYFALFAAVMIGIVTEPIPAAALGLVGVVVAAGLSLVHTSTSQSALWALSGFANGTVWLI